MNLKSRRPNDFKNWSKEERIVFQNMMNGYNDVVGILYSLNNIINRINLKSIIIARNAGVGKTHLSAHLNSELKKRKQLSHTN